MKTNFRSLIAVAGLTALAVGIASAASAADSDAPKGSIRPGGKLKPSELPGLTHITFQQALEAALAKAGGGVIKAELEVEDGNLMYSFEIVRDDKRITEVEIDAGNGKVLGTEDETAEVERESAKKSPSKD